MHMATFVIAERKSAVPNAEYDALWLSFHNVLKSVIHRNCHLPTYLAFSMEVEEALAAHKLFKKWEGKPTSTAAAYDTYREGNHKLLSNVLYRQRKIVSGSAGVWV
jgi:dimeric dUTPase (all-alpha-NTP-PPase superfamily)